MKSKIMDDSPTQASDYLRRKAKELNVEDVAFHVLNHPRFFLWSGSSKPNQHHYGKHGLIVHTAEVAHLCHINNLVFKSSIDDRWLYLAALFHDCGKMWDYEPLSENYETWGSTSHKRQVHHISRSALIWHEATLNHKVEGLTQSIIDDILHAILAHHGQRDYGSPVAPNTQLAWMLHLCDGISARMYDAGQWDGVKDK